MRHDAQPLIDALYRALLGPARPAHAAGIRGLTRGGAEGAAASAARIADAQAAGTTLTAGQATGSRTLQTIEGASSKLSGGGTLNKLLDSQDQHVGNSVRQIADSLAKNDARTPEAAGAAIEAGAKALTASVRDVEAAAYDRVASLVPPEIPVDIASTRAALDKLATPTPGAEATTGALIPPAISQMRDNLNADAASGTLPYGATRALRTHVGNFIDWGFAPNDPVKNGALKSVYGALTEDLNRAASATSPEASEAVAAANAMHQTNAAQSELLDHIVNRNGGSEAVYNAALSGSKAGATKIRTVMGALNPDQQNLFRATILGKLGLVPASGQNAEGDVFRVGSFLTHWNNLSDDAKDALFGSASSSGLRRSLDSVAKTAADIRGGAQLANPAGTGKAWMHSEALWKALETLGEGAAVATSHLGVAGAAIAGNMGLSRLLTAPWFARWLATSTRLPATALPAAVAALQRESIARKDQDGLNIAHALATHLAQPRP